MTGLAYRQVEPHAARGTEPVIRSAPEGPFEAEVCDDAARLSEEWDALADRVSASPFLRPGWVLTWARHFAGGPVVALAVRRQERLVAFLPMLRGVGSLRSPTNVHTPAFGALAESDAAATSLFEWVCSQAAHRVSLSYLEDGGRDATACLAAARLQRHQTLVRLLQQQPCVILEKDWASLEGKLSSKLRADLRRRTRRLEEAGTLRFEVVDGERDLDRFLAEGFGVEPSGWKAERGTAIASRADTRAFYTEVAKWAAGRGILRLAFLRLEERPLAFQLGFEESGSYYFLKGGYDPAFHAYAPGKLLVLRTLERAAKVGLQTYEFLGTAEPWKMEWATICRKRISLSRFDHSVIGTLWWAAERFARPIVRSIRSHVRP